MPPQSEVVTVEFKINLFAPAQGERLVAHGTVVRSGRTITVCQGMCMPWGQTVRSIARPWWPR